MSLIQYMSLIGIIYLNTKSPCVSYSGHSRLNNAIIKEESVSNPDSPVSGDQQSAAALNPPQIPLHPSSPTPTSSGPFNAMAAAGKHRDIRSQLCSSSLRI